MGQFSLLDIKPKPHTFRDQDGAIYEVPTARMFGTNAFGRLTWLQEQLPNVLAELKAAESEDATLPAITLLDQTVNEFFRMLVPDMPPDRVFSLGLHDKLQFIQWWQKQEQKASPQVAPGEATAVGKVTRGRRSPALSASTNSRPKKS
jgi:hypothetical protein